jgi:hypothetical protein
MDRSWAETTQRDIAQAKEKSGLATAAGLEADTDRQRKENRARAWGRINAGRRAYPKPGVKTRLSTGGGRKWNRGSTGWVRNWNQAGRPTLVRKKFRAREKSRAMAAAGNETRSQNRDRETQLRSCKIKKSSKQYTWDSKADFLLKPTKIHIITEVTDRPSPYLIIKIKCSLWHTNPRLKIAKWWWEKWQVAPIL